MKAAAIKSLVYKEFYMAKKQMLGGILTFLVFAVMGILVEISFRSGNLALLSDAIKDDIKQTADFSAVIFPVLMACSLTSYIADVSLKDEETAWKRFCYATPASHVDFAVAKYVAFLITILAESGISFIYAAFLCSIMGDPFSVLYVAYVSGAVALTTLMAVLTQVGALLFHTKNKAGLFMFAAFFVMILIPTLISRNFSNAEVTKEVVDNSLIFLLPWLLVMTAVILAVGCAVSSVLLKRRES